MSLIEKDGFYREYDLYECREQKSILEPVIHQKKALNSLLNWFNKKQDPQGGILALPTGAGKTFTAIRFLCQHPLSQGYKVLWLAHTQHLLEQAFFTFGPKYGNPEKGSEVGYISEPRENLKVRVVSGAKQFFPPKQIKGTDDVIIATLQTITRAYNNFQPNLMNFLDSADGKLFVVFDEAHHAAAPSYRRLIESLREKYPDMYLLGLTATPTASTESKKMWLSKLFPQSTISQVTLDELMAQNILSQPKFKKINTNIKANFKEGDFQKWINTYNDLPQKLIKDLAENEERNKIISDNYVENKDEYGKTIIFTDRWYQCVTLCKFLRNRGVKADVMFTMVNKSLGSAGTAQRNLEALDKFKTGKIDVLINVKMLTEGTDVPDAQTVFLTRQTTSQILLTQMIGRALRGSKFGGTDIANIVSFVDDWDYEINWAEWDQLPTDTPDEDEPSPPTSKVPLELISIKLVIDWANERDNDNQIRNECKFSSLMPIGWYLTEFDILIENEDPESVKDFVLVFEKENEIPEKENYDDFIEYLKTENLESFESEDLIFDLSNDSKIKSSLQNWFDKFFQFSYNENKINEILRNLFKIARHMAQNDNEAPKFFSFEDRGKHNLDDFAKTLVDEDLGPKALDDACKEEYGKDDRYWKALYPDYTQFKAEVDHWITKSLNPPEKFSTKTPWKNDDDDPDREPLAEELRQFILHRDNYTCQCCGETDKKLLEIDHIKPRYYVTDNSEDNLQVLCKLCNRLKGIDTINFRKTRTPLKKEPVDFPALDELYELDEIQVQDSFWWEKFLRRKTNFFYKCHSLESVNIMEKDEFSDSWELSIHSGNNIDWIKPYLDDFPEIISKERQNFGFNNPKEIIIPNILDHLNDGEVLIVPAKFALDEYLNHSVYMCQLNRSFRPTDYIAFYSEGKISKYIPKILDKAETLYLARYNVNKPNLSPEINKRLISLINSLEKNDEQERLNDFSQVFFLSPADSNETIKLENDIINDKKDSSGRKTAFAQGTRYIPIEKFKNNPKTTSELE